MGFAFRKLYPIASQLAVPTCCLDINEFYGCPCDMPCIPIIIIEEICECPTQIYIERQSCYGTSPPTCSVFDCPNSIVFGGLPGLDLDLCTFKTVECSCRTIGFSWCMECEDYVDDPCCNRNLCYGVSWRGTLNRTRAYFDQCEISGAVPHTYRIENLNGVTGQFTCRLQSTSTSPTRYAEFTLGEYNTPSITGYSGDPDFVADQRFRRFYKTPQNMAGTSSGATAGYSPFCLKLHSTQSQSLGIENRVMFISGRNIYRYSGLLSGDPSLKDVDPFWDNGGMTGVTGIKQYETSLPISTSNGTSRSFPLPDNILTLPLWGQDANDNLGLLRTDCRSPYDVCGGVNDRRCQGCVCVRSNPSDPEVGHYLSNDYFGSGSGLAGYTAGYFSFSSFNPQAYLDYVNGPTFAQDIVPAGGANALGFGHLGEGLMSFNCDYGNTNCRGCSGATSHGPRLGVPTCSVWSLVKSLYSRVFYAAKGIQSPWMDPVLTESDFRTQNGPTGFKEFSDAIDAMLADDPSQITTGGTSKVQWHLAKVAAALEKESHKFISDPTSAYYWGDTGKFVFTFPNVFLWDQTSFEAASATDKWKYLYVVGNGNVIYDSRSVAINRPYSATGPYNDLHPDITGQDYRSSVVYLNEVNHQRSGLITPSSNHARMVVFNGSGGPTGTGSPSINRRTATSKITLVEMPICAGITHEDDPDVPVSICSLCNAFPNYPCIPDQGCSPITAIRTEPIDGNPSLISSQSFVEYVNCEHLGGKFAEPNGLTASYRVR